MTLEGWFVHLSIPADTILQHTRCFGKKRKKKVAHMISSKEWEKGFAN